MKYVFRTALMAGILAATTAIGAAPASAQRYYEDRPSFGFYFGSGAPSHYGHPGPAYRNCRPVRHVWVDRWGYRHVDWRPVCRPFRGGHGYGYGGGWGGRW